MAGTGIWLFTCHHSMQHTRNSQVILFLSPIPHHTQYLHLTLLSLYSHFSLSFFPIPVFSPFFLSFLFFFLFSFSFACFPPPFPPFPFHHISIFHSNIIHSSFTSNTAIIPYRPQCIQYTMPHACATWVRSPDGPCTPHSPALVPGSDHPNPGVHPELHSSASGNRQPGEYHLGLLDESSAPTNVGCPV